MANSQNALRNGITNRHRKYGIIISVFLLLISAAFLGRGWIRGDGFEWFTNVYHKPQVLKQYDMEFSEVNNKLAKLGVNNWSGVFSACEDSMYEGIGVSGGCYVSSKSGYIDDFEKLKIKWQQQSQSFNDYMLNSGWQKGWVGENDITTLLDADPGISTYDIGYSKTSGQIECSIRIGYNPRDTDGRKVFVDEYCSIYVSIFGGY